MLKNIVYKFCKEINESVVNLLSRYNALSKTHQRAFTDLRGFLLNGDGNDVFVLFDVLVHCYIEQKIPDSTRGLPSFVVEEISRCLDSDSAAVVTVVTSTEGIKAQVAQKIMRILKKFLLNIVKEHHRVIVRIPKSHKDITLYQECLYLLLIEYVYRHHMFSNKTLDKNTVKSMHLDSKFKKFIDSLDKEVYSHLMDYLLLLRKK